MFGYMVLFVSAFPLAPFLGYVSNILQIHQFGEAMLHRKQRNLPVGVQDIGSFQRCFEAVAALCVATNSGLIFFTMRKNYFPGGDVDLAVLVWLFFGTQALVFGLVALVSSAVDDVPEFVATQLARQEFVRGELFDDDLFSGKAAAAAEAAAGNSGAPPQPRPSHRV